MTTTAAPAQRVRRPAKLRQLSGLDGLRAIAVVAVIVYHLNPSWLPGGYLGVDIFFVISGYLITSLLLAEWNRSSRIALGAFWLRRARRLLPALITMLAVVTVLAGFFARDSLQALRGGVLASLGYVMNWFLLAQHQSYAASLGRPPLLLHLWSLSVEEQFYLLWPLAVIVLRRRLSSARLGLVAGAGALVSAVLMAAMYTGSNPSAVYFSTPSHAQGLLIGCALAALVPPWRMVATVPRPARRLLDQSGLAALSVVAVGLATLGFYSAETYRGGLLMVDVATALVVATIAHPASRLGPALGRQPLRWVGLRSYSLYLWHWPIFEMTRPGIDVAFTGWPVLVLRLGLTAGAAELSYRYVEQPWRTGRAQAALRSFAAANPPWRLGAGAAAPIVAVVAVLATAPAHAEPAFLLQGSTTAARGSPVGAPASAARGAGATGGTHGLSATSALVAGQHGSAGPATAQSPASGQAMTSTASAGGPTTTTLPYIPPVEEPVLALGDSVLLAASPALSATFGSKITIDAEVGRQVPDGLARLAAYRASGELRRYRAVMIDLGTNGAFEPAEFRELTQLVQGVPRVVVFDVHADRPWTAESNATILAGVAADPYQMRLADWNRAAHPAHGPGLVYPDGVHPDDAGSAVYSRLLLNGISNP